MRRVDFVIIGQGLAGTTLAWALLHRGRSVLVLDREPAVTSSRVAAGLVTPITGKRLNLSWRIDELLPAADRFYERVGAEIGRTVYSRRPTVRVFADADEASLFETRRADFGGHAAELSSPLDASVAAPFGGFEMPTAGRLDVGTYLEASRKYLTERGSYEGRIGRGETETESLVIYCQGVEAVGNPLFPAVHFRPAKGEILTVRIPGWTETRVLNRSGFWVAPTDMTEVCRVGATYSWQPLDTTPTPDARAELSEHLGRLLRRPFEVIDQHAAVRPIMNRSKPVLGLHPTDPRLGFFNGLGSKGSLVAPYFAEQFADHLCGRGAVDPEVDLRTVWKSSS